MVGKKVEGDEFWQILEKTPGIPLSMELLNFTNTYEMTMGVMQDGTGIWAEGIDFGLMFPESITKEIRKNEPGMVPMTKFLLIGQKLADAAEREIIMLCRNLYGPQPHILNEKRFFPK